MNEELDVRQSLNSIIVGYAVDYRGESYRGNEAGY